MTANGKRVGLGVLGSVSGLGATGGLGLMSGANKAWNAVTPKSLNTSQGWTQGLNQVYDQTANFAENSIKDVVGGLTGDTDYHTSRMQNSLEQGWNDPSVDPVSRAIAQTAAGVGENAWTGATSLYGGNAALNAFGRLPGVAAGGQLLAKTPGFAPVMRATSYATGMPMASNLNQAGMLASQMGQATVGAGATAYDGLNAAHGIESNYAGMVPMFAAQQGLSNVIGEDAANVVNSYAGGRFMQGMTPGEIGVQIGLPAAVEVGTRLYSQPQPEQVAAQSQGQPQTEQAAPSPSIMSEPGPTGLPHVDAATYADPQARSNLYARAVSTPPPPEQTAAVQTSMAAAAQPDAPPEAKQQAQSDFQSFMQQQADSNPQFKSGAADLVSGDPARQNSQAAQAFRQHLQTVGNDVQDAELQRLYAANPNPTPQQAGGFVAQAQDAWNNLGPHGQMMVGLGAPLALAGMAMSMFGDEEGGGILPMLLSILGLGMAGLGAAGSGVMGDGAQQMVGGGIRNFANMMGAKIPEGNQDLSALLKGPDAAVSSAGGGWRDALDIKGKLQKAEQLKQLTSMPSYLAIPLLRNLDPEHIKTPQDAQAAYANAMALRQQLDNPESSLAKSLATAQTIDQGINKAQDVATGWWNKAKSTFGG
jgi:hypothetical protein